MTPELEIVPPLLSVSRGWPTSRIVWTAILCTVVQTGIVLGLGKMPRTVPTRWEPAGQMMWVWDAKSAATVLQGCVAAHPDAFGDDPRDPFQAVAARALPRPAYRFAQWSAPPQWLTNPPSAPAVLMDPVPVRPRSYAVAKPALPADPLLTLISTQTFASVPGSLSARAWERAPRLGSWAGTEVLGSTRMEVLVNPQGWVVAAEVAESSGSRVADETARQSLLEARFRALPGTSRRPDFNPATLTRGAVLIQWHTDPSIR